MCDLRLIDMMFAETELWALCRPHHLQWEGFNLEREALISLHYQT